LCFASVSFCKSAFSSGIATLAPLAPFQIPLWLSSIQMAGRTPAHFELPHCNMAAKASVREKLFDYWKFSSNGIVKITKLPELSDFSRKMSVERPT